LTDATYRDEGPLGRLFAGQHKTYKQLVRPCIADVEKRSADNGHCAGCDSLQLAGHGLLTAISNALWPLITLLLVTLILDKGNKVGRNTFPIGQHRREIHRVAANVAGEVNFALGVESSGHLLALRKQHLARLDEPRVGRIGHWTGLVQFLRDVFDETEF
jgi:hypothetical protein